MAFCLLTKPPPTSEGGGDEGGGGGGGGEEPGADGYVVYGVGLAIVVTYDTPPHINSTITNPASGFANAAKAFREIST